MIDEVMPEDKRLDGPPYGTTTIIDPTRQLKR